MQILLFAGLKDLAEGKNSVELNSLPVPCTVAELVAVLNQQWPQLGKHSFRVAVNAVFAEPEMVIPANAEVALIPPVSGG